MALTFKNKVQVFILPSLLENPKASGIFFLLEVNLIFLECFKTQVLTVSEVRDKAHQEINFFDRNCQLSLCDDVFVGFSVNLNYFSLFFLAGGEVCALHTALAKPEKRVRIHVA
jgi:hypothetical protein